MEGAASTVAASRRRPGAVGTALVVAAASAWLGAVLIARSMDGGMSMGGMETRATGVDLAVFLGAWLVMMAAMMIPSALPMILLYERAARSRLSTVLFAAGYLLLWGAYGGVAYAVYALLHGRFVSMDDVQRLGRPAAAAALAVAAIYQVSPLKRACLRHCRSPLSFVMHHWRPGRLGALRMGAVHGTWCVGCCTGLMLVLFSLGVMSLVLMVVLALLILAEKEAPFGVWLSRATSAALAGLAVAIAISPEVFARLT